MRFTYSKGFNGMQLMPPPIFHSYAPATILFINSNGVKKLTGTSLIISGKLEKDDKDLKSMRQKMCNWKRHNFDLNALVSSEKIHEGEIYVHCYI